MVCAGSTVCVRGMPQPRTRITSAQSPIPQVERSIPVWCTFDADFIAEGRATMGKKLTKSMWQVERRAIAPEAVGARIKQARLLCGARVGTLMSQGEAVARVIQFTGVPLAQAQWSRWEIGDRVPSLEQLFQIALATDVPPEWLAFGIGAPMPGMLPPNS